MKGLLMNRGSTHFLRAAIAAMGLAALALCAVVLPALHREWATEFPDLAALRYPAILGLSVTAIAFWTALYQALKLLDYIDKNKAFSIKSVDALKNIEYCGLIIGGLYAMALPLVYIIANNADAPGLIIVGMIFTGAPIVVAVFAGVAQRLLQNVIEIKSENDLTV